MTTWRLHAMGRRLWPPQHARGVAGLRRLMGDFIRAVHPDLSPEFPEEARRINQRSLAELNAFIDILEKDGPRPFDDGPESAHELPFFRAFRTRLGRVVPQKVEPLSVTLPSLPAAAQEAEKEFAAAYLIRGAQVALESSSSTFSDRPDVPKLFTQKGAGRAAFDKLWWQQTQEELLRDALHGPDDAEVRLHVAKRVFACKYASQLMRRYQRIKNNQRRKLRIAQLDEVVEAKIKEKFHSVEPSEEAAREENEKKDPLRVLQGGFHPDLVFMAPGLSETQRREAIRRVCGMNLAEADFWLLENLWKAMRSGPPPPVPLVIAEKDYKAHGSGFIQIPWDFSVSSLCDLLEEHLESTREALQRRRQRCSVASGGGAAMVSHGKPSMPSELATNAALSALARTRRWRRAVQDAVSYDTLIAAVPRSWSWSLHLLAEAAKRRLQCSEEALSSALGTCALAAAWCQAVCLCGLSGSADAAMLDRLALARTPGSDHDHIWCLVLEQSCRAGLREFGEK
eukprot:s29_g69.t1